MYKSIFILTLTLFVSCTTTRYYTDSLSDTKIPSFRSYSVEGHCDDELSPISVIRLENSVNLVLQERGYVRSDNPDLVVQAFLKNKNMVSVTDCNPYDRWEGGEQCVANYINYEEGTLVIDLIDAKTNQIFWHGAAVGNSFKYTREPDARILKLVTRLFDDYFDGTKQASSDVAIQEK